MYNVKNLYAKIKEIDKKLDKNREKLWKATEEKRKLEADLIELREKLFNIAKGD